LWLKIPHRPNEVADATNSPYSPTALVVVRFVRSLREAKSKVGARVVVRVSSKNMQDTRSDKRNQIFLVFMFFFVLQSWSRSGHVPLIGNEFQIQLATIYLLCFFLWNFDDFDFL
jgi:hypothetical protein